MFLQHQTGFGGLRIVDQHVDAAVLFDSLCDHTVYRVFFRSIGGKIDHLSAEGFQLSFCFFQRSGGTSRDDEIRTFFRECFCNSKAQALAASGDNYGFSCHVCHMSSPFIIVGKK